LAYIGANTLGSTVAKPDYKFERRQHTGVRARRLQEMDIWLKAHGG